MSFIITVTTRKRTDNSFDVFLKYHNDDPIIAGTVVDRRETRTFDTAYWAYPAHESALTTCDTKWEAVRVLARHAAVRYFDDSTLVYGRRQWRAVRDGVDA
jgi:hypothetical protein